MDDDLDLGRAPMFGTAVAGTNRALFLSWTLKSWVLGQHVCPFSSARVWVAGLEVDGKMSFEAEVLLYWDNKRVANNEITSTNLALIMSAKQDLEWEMMYNVVENITDEKWSIMLGGSYISSKSRSV